MSVLATNRYLDPAVLAEVSGLDLVAKTVVQGFIAGLHRSPDFGFSQEFAEYRAYTPGDDLRHVDWNVFARTDKAYLKRYRGETNTELTIMLDASASMNFQSGGVTKFEYARFLTAALAYLAHLQRDSTGLIVFHDEVANFVRPSSRQGQLMRLLHTLDTAETGKRTNYERPFIELRRFLRRRGMAVVVSDFLAPVAEVIKAIEPLRFARNEIILFQILDPRELAPALAEPALLLDMETGETIEVTPGYARNEYREKMTAHLENLKTEARRNGMEYFLLNTERPLDSGLREYLTIRQRRL